MASQTRTLKIPGDLAEAAEIRAKLLKYPSWGAYIKGLMRYDMMVQGEHSITLPIALLSLMDQDKWDAKLLEATKKGVGERGVFLKHLMERLIEATNATKAHESASRKKKPRKAPKRRK